MIYYNNLSAFTEVHLGNTNITEVYFGDVKKWPTGPQPFGGKFKLKLIDSTVVTAACDSTSAVTRNEISSQYSGTVVSAEIGDCVISIGNVAFTQCTSLTSCTIGSSVTSIGTNAFYRCSGLTNIDIPNSVTTIGNNAFVNCTSLASATLGNNVASINNYTFSECKSLTGITIPNSVTSIGQEAFFNCTSLTDLTIPDSVTTISRYAFQNCSGLTSITVNAVTPPSLGNNVFYNTNDCPIYVPAESVSVYKSASGWSTYADRIQAIP